MGQCLYLIFHNEVQWPKGEGVVLEDLAILEEEVEVNIEYGVLVFGDVGVM